MTGSTCGAVHEGTNLQCLLAEGHFVARNTRHRVMFRRVGGQRRILRWGPGVDVAAPVDESK